MNQPHEPRIPVPLTAWEIKRVLAMMQQEQFLLSRLTSADAMPDELRAMVADLGRRAKEIGECLNEDRAGGRLQTCATPEAALMETQDSLASEEHRVQQLLNTLATAEKHRDDANKERDAARHALAAHVCVHTCSKCGESKPTPYRRDDLGGYVCLTCVEKYLNEQLAENWKLRQGLARVTANFGNGSAASPKSSAEFLSESVPNEVKVYACFLRDELRKAHAVLRETIPLSDNINLMRRQSEKLMECKAWDENKKG